MAISKQTIEALVNEGKKAQEIADELYVSVTYIRRLINKYGIDYQSGSIRCTEEWLKKVQEFFDRGLTMPETADAMNVSYSSIYWATRKYNLNPPVVQRIPPVKPTKKFVIEKKDVNVPDTLFDGWFHTCPICERKFVIRDCSTYAYKTSYSKDKPQGTKYTYYCSWSCLQKSRENAPKKKYKRERYGT